MTNTNTTKFVTTIVLSAALLATAFIAMPASAATYAYVDVTGEVKSVTANDWMTAIAIAPNIHMHSGVLLLKSAADYIIVGGDVKSI